MYSDTTSNIYTQNNQPHIRTHHNNNNKNIVVSKNTQFKHNIKPFFIYFPQFHSIRENSTFFYEDYNDINRKFSTEKSLVSERGAFDEYYLLKSDKKDYEDEEFVVKSNTTIPIWSP